MIQIVTNIWKIGSNAYLTVSFCELSANCGGKSAESALKLSAKWKPATVHTESHTQKKQTHTRIIFLLFVYLFWLKCRLKRDKIPVPDANCDMRNADVAWNLRNLRWKYEKTIIWQRTYHLRLQLRLCCKTISIIMVRIRCISRRPNREKPRKRWQWSRIGQHFTTSWCSFTRKSGKYRVAHTRRRSNVT